MGSEADKPDFILDTSALDFATLVEPDRRVFTVDDLKHALERLADAPAPQFDPYRHCAVMRMASQCPPVHRELWEDEKYRRVCEMLGIPPPRGEKYGA